MASRKVVVVGIRQIDAKLRKLPYKIQGKVVRPAVRDGLKLMADSVKGEIRSMDLIESGAMLRGVKVRSVRGRKRGAIAMEVRVDPPEAFVRTSLGGERAFYPAVQEYGSAHVPARPFMHVAFGRDAGRARDAAIARLKAGVNREIEALS